MSWWERPFIITALHADTMVWHIATTTRPNSADTLCGYNIPAVHFRGSRTNPFLEVGDDFCKDCERIHRIESPHWKKGR
jgi:hypothetical protein